MSENVPRRPDARPRRALGTRIRLVQGDYCIGGQGEAHQLTGPATAIFAALDGRNSVADVIQLVSTQYDVDPEEAAADVWEFLDDLTSRGVVAW